MLSLTHKLDSEWRTSKGDLKIDLAFNTVLQWYELSEEDMALDKKIQIGWMLFFGTDILNFESIDDYELAANTLSEVADYITHDPYSKIDEVADTESPTTKWFSYRQDAEAIYASFIFDYNIDLIEEQNELRWEKFRAMFNNLSAKSPLMRIVEIRQRDTNGLEGQALTDLVQAQNYYALEGQSADQLNSAFGDMFNMLDTSINEDNK